jgi:Family of unknown function (DUF5335)
MKNRLVPRAEWLRFFTDFSRRHQHETATVRVLSARLGSQVEASALPLEGIVASPRGDAVSIHLGIAPERHVEHPVESPEQVWVELTEDGAEQAIAIESAAGVQTILELQPARMSCACGA